MSGGHDRTSTVRHHPSEATLIAHAAGSLGQAAGAVVMAHLARCLDCRAKVGLAEAIGGLLLEGLPPAPLAPNALRRTLEQLEDEPPQKLRPGPPIGRLRWLAPGIRHVMLLREGGRDGWTLRLLRVRPGTALPRHGHSGAELTLVLKGAFTDETGRYGPGDLAEVEKHVSHRPVAAGTQDCVCLVATQGRLRFEGLVARLFGGLAFV